MLETIRRYWIGLLVIVLVGLHASIVGVIRYQASLAKVDASCEVDLGQYLAFQNIKKAPLEMKLHAIVPLNHRMKSRQLIELNKAQIRQSLEEYLRQLDGKLLTDPYFADLKTQLLEVMVQTIGSSSIDDLVITEVRESRSEASLEFASHGHGHAQRRLVATLRTPEADGSDEELKDGDHLVEDEHPTPAHTEPDAKSHSAPKTTKDGHGAATKKTTSHAPAKKPAATSGHGAAKTPAKEAKKSGH